MKTEVQKQRAHTIRKTLAKAIRHFSHGYFSESWHMLSTLETISLSEKERQHIHKLLNLLVLGEFFGYHNFCQLLDVYQLSTHHVYRLWKHCTHDQLTAIVEHFFWLAFQERLLDLCHKSDSTWSRMDVTLVIGHRFYPIRFYISSKAHAELDVAKTLLAEVEQKLDTFKTQEHVDFPNLFLSVDNGFCHADLFDATNDITMISVPKKSWVFEIDGQRMSLKKHIDRFLEEERTHDASLFPLRKRAVGNTLGDVVLLFFRLNTSSKISVIVTDQLDIFAKTLRRRWFQRTYIEQFFRFSKHTLAIQSSKSTTAEGFDQKASVNFLKVLVCQTFTSFCREQSPCCQTWSFEKIRRHLIYDHIDQTFLEHVLFHYDDLLHSIDAVTA